MGVIQNYYAKNNGRTNSSNCLDRQTRAKELPKFQQIEYDYFNFFCTLVLTKKHLRKYVFLIGSKPT